MHDALQLHKFQKKKGETNSRSGSEPIPAFSAQLAQPDPFHGIGDDSEVLVRPFRPASTGQQATSRSSSPIPFATTGSADPFTLLSGSQPASSQSPPRNVNGLQASQTASPVLKNAYTPTLAHYTIASQTAVADQPIAESLHDREHRELEQRAAAAQRDSALKAEEVEHLKFALDRMTQENAGFAQIQQVNVERLENIISDSESRIYKLLARERELESVIEKQTLEIAQLRNAQAAHTAGSSIATNHLSEQMHLLESRRTEQAHFIEQEKQKLEKDRQEHERLVEKQMQELMANGEYLVQQLADVQTQKQQLTEQETMIASMVEEYRQKLSDADKSVFDRIEEAEKYAAEIKRHAELLVTQAEETNARIIKDQQALDKATVDHTAAVALLAAEREAFETQRAALAKEISNIESIKDQLLRDRQALDAEIEAFRQQ
eukprot:jgi/Hompol1/4903/HPOL_004013-RA